MTAQYALPTGELLSFKPGLPPRFTGPVLNGVQLYFTNSSFCELVVQEYRTDYISIRNIHVNWIKPGRIICQYDYDPSLFSRAVINNSLREYIKGAGEFMLNKEDFAMLTGSKWVGLLVADAPMENHFIDFAWSAGIFENMHSEYPEVHDLLQNITDGLPDRLKGPPHHLDTYMQRVLSDLFLVDFTVAGATEIFEDCLEKYLIMILREAKEYKTLKKKIREADRENIVKAQQLIDENPGKHFTIPEICAIMGMNEYKLKKLFPIVTGFNIDEYRKYWLCIKAAKKIVQMPDVPLKNFYSAAGYTSETTFVRGFKRLCYCTPGELRNDGWDLEGLGI